MGWGELVSSKSNDGRGKYPALGGKSDSKALSKIGLRTSDSSNCLIQDQGIVLDMGEASREQGFRLNGCR